MAQKRRFLDVWIIETNTVYREVPFEVVTDWVQQGRLLADDRLRPSGTAEWFRLGDNPSFAAYLPHADPYAANDQAEALEPVQGDFAWRPGPGDEDDDVDMIPLIDVSLVLLVFFMMTAGAAAVAVALRLPAAQRNLISSKEDMIWVGIHASKVDPASQPPSYSLGLGSRPPASKEDEGLMTQQAVMERFRLLLEERRQDFADKNGGNSANFLVEVQIKADENLPAGYVRRMQLALQQRSEVGQQYWGVFEKQP